MTPKNNFPTRTHQIRKDLHFQKNFKSILIIYAVVKLTSSTFYPKHFRCRSTLPRFEEKKNTKPSFRSIYQARITIQITSYLFFDTKQVMCKVIGDFLHCIQTTLSAEKVKRWTSCQGKWCYFKTFEWKNRVKRVGLYFGIWPSDTLPGPHWTSLRSGRQQ